MPVVSWTDLQQQIAQRERELQELRRELESRQSQFTELTRRKEELQRQLRQVEREIDVLAASPSPQREPAEPAESVTPTVPSPAASREVQPRLGEWIVSLLREVGGPMTAWQLCEEGRHRGYQPTSQNPLKSVESRLRDLTNQGVVRRASGQLGYILTASATGSGSPKSKSHQAAQTKTEKTSAKPVESKPVASKNNGKKSSSSGTAPTSPAESRGEHPTLRETLTHVLKNSPKRLTARELAEQILASGYRSGSKNFVKLIGIKLGKMENIDYVAGKGYRLKKS